MTIAVKNKTFIDSAAENPAALPWLEGAKSLNGAPAWMTALRATGAEVFARTGIPHPKQEGWQYFNLRELKAEKFTFGHVVSMGEMDLPPMLLPDCDRIVLVNGQFQPALSQLPEGAEVLPLAEAEGAEEHVAAVGDLGAHPFVALNSAYVRDGFVLRVAKGKDLSRPVEVLYWNTGKAAVYPRVLYQLGANAAATVIERHMGEGAYFANLYAAAVLAQDARFRLYRFVDESADALHVSHLQLQLHKNAHFEGFSGSFAGGQVRQECRMQLLGDHIYSNIGGIYLLKDRQGHDFTLLSDHFEPDGTSVQHFKGVVDDSARAVFQGKIYVHRPAQKTDGYQSHHALLLSDTAEANAKPELEIYADDVKCSHGATAGKLDTDALFYLQSRGIPAVEAKALLIRSFLGEAVERLGFEPVRAVYHARIAEWLGSRK